MSIYDVTANRINGEQDSLDNYKDQVHLIVNTASECGFRPQFGELQELCVAYSDKGFPIFGLISNQVGNQDRGFKDDISEFIEINDGITLPMFEEIHVKGENAQPLFK